MTGRADRTSFRVLLLAGATLALAACSGNGLETAMDDPLDGLIGGDPMVALGLRADPNVEEIEYGPRSPLVVPGDASTLPPPRQASDDLGASWPDDPDARARRERREARIALANAEVVNTDRTDLTLSPQELDAWAAGNPARTTREPGRVPQAEQQERDKTVNPRELLDRRADPTQLSRAEPVRRSLAEPPAGYRTPAPAADGTINVPPPKEESFLDKILPW